MKGILFTILLLLIVVPAYAQNEKNSELISEVKALNEYQDVVNQIYHTGWPQKNIKMLRSLLPVVEKGYNKIKKAELPGILIEKKSKWEDGLKRFGVCVDMYKIATAKKDSVSLLNASEKLYAQYEVMVRIVKPAMKETEAFHQTLYLIYKYYISQNEFEKIKNASATLKVKMDGLNKAPLISRLKGKEEKFTNAKTELTAAVDKLNEIVKEGDKKKEIDKAVETIHVKYQELEKLFD
jgi:hypothetical protein